MLKFADQFDIKLQTLNTCLSGLGRFFRFFGFGQDQFVTNIPAIRYGKLLKLDGELYIYSGGCPARIEESKKYKVFPYILHLAFRFKCIGGNLSYLIKIK